MNFKKNLNLSNYTRPNVSNVGEGKEAFDQGLRLLLAFQHEASALYFLECVKLAPDCALAYAFIAYCHCPNYNFKGEAYYEYSKPVVEKDDNKDTEGLRPGWKFPCQSVADYHSKIAVEITEKLQGIDRSIQDVEVKLISSIRLLTCNPGIDSDASEEVKDVPFAEMMQVVYNLYPEDPEVVYIYVSAIMTLHAWKLFEYPNGRPLSSDVPIIQKVLEEALEKFPTHVGLCHMYCHLSEMSASPGIALPAAKVLRTTFPDAGHLVHMPTHIDVLVGDYESCVRWNKEAIEADKKAMELAPETNGPTSFYFGYIVHDYHMCVYGCILGGFEQVAMDVATEINTLINEEMFTKRRDLATYLESYGAMDIHIMVRFGRWNDILNLQFPKDKNLMLYRSASLYFARALAYANLRAPEAAIEEAAQFEKLRYHPEAPHRILHNNVVSDLIAVDCEMMKGEIAYFQGNHDKAFKFLKKAIQLQDALNYDEPWGRMQPIRHALGGLLLKHGHETQAEAIFRDDLKLHPKNPWALAGLIGCIAKQIENESDPTTDAKSCCCEKKTEQEELKSKRISEMCELKQQLEAQRSLEWADFPITHACQCCCPP